jgi:hypothetical protein
MPELVTIPIAIFDVVMDYTQPNMKLLMDRIKVVDRLFAGYKPWKIKVDDVEIISEGKPSEQGIKFKIPSKRTSFFFGAASCRLTRDDADWESAEETIAILNVGLTALTEVAGVQIGTYKTSISLHIQPKTAQFIDLLRPFASSQITVLDASPMKAFATIVRWDRRRITVDNSAQLANAVFLKFDREFEGVASIEEIAHQLRVDEEELFAVLGVQEDRP